MTHIKTDIRAAVIAALSGGTRAGVAVASGRGVSLPKDVVHAIRIFIPSEGMEPRPNGKGGHRLNRTYEISVVATGRVSGDVEPHDDADGFQVEIEKSLAADVTLGGVCVELFPSGATTAFVQNETSTYELVVTYQAQATRTKLLEDF